MLGDPDALRQSLQVITPKSAVVSTHLAPRGHGQSPKVLRRQVLSGILDRKDNCHERLSLPPTGRTA